MIVNETDYEDYLAHFGIPGMKWGHHKSGGSTSSGRHVTAKKAFKAGAAATVVVGGAAASAYVLHKYGAKKAIEVGMKSVKAAQKIKGVSDTVKSDYGYQKPHPTTEKGAQATASLASQAEWKKKVSDVLGDMQQANKSQDDWMRKQGLGHVVNQAGNSD